jgi:ketosteroid isomerase-like protein
MKIAAYMGVLLAAVLMACETKTLPETKAPKAIDAAMGRALFEAFNAHNWTKMAGLYSDDAVFLDPSLGQYPVRQSKDSIVAKYTALQAFIPDITDSLVSVWPCDSNKLVVEFVSKGTMPDSSVFRLPIVSILTFRNGKIISDHTYYDNSGE